MASNLAPVYLDDARVTLQGDPRPQVSKILQAGGHAAEQSVVVVRLREASGADGHPLGLDDFIDREKAVTPVYLRILQEGSKGAAQLFAESQSFADPAHKGGSPRVAQGARPSQEVPPSHRDDGGIRTQETASEEGAAPTRRPRRATTTTTSRGALEKASEEE